MSGIGRSIAWPRVECIHAPADRASVRPPGSHCGCKILQNSAYRNTLSLIAVGSCPFAIATPSSPRASHNGFAPYGRSNSIRTNPKTEGGSRSSMARTSACLFQQKGHQATHTTRPACGARGEMVLPPECCARRSHRVSTARSSTGDFEKTKKPWVELAS